MYPYKNSVHLIESILFIEQLQNISFQKWLDQKI